MERPIRILQVFGALNRGGAETMIMNIYGNMDTSQIQFDFIIHTKEKCDFTDEIVKLGGKIYSVPAYRGLNHFAYKKAWKDFFHRHPEYKIVHGHMRSTASIYMSIAKKYGRKTIAHSHSTASRGNRLERLVKNLMQIPIRYIADYLFACSNEAGKWLFGKRSLGKDNYRVIKNAIETEKYVFNEAIRNEIRKKIGVEHKFVVGHVGSFTYPKNHSFLIDVFYQIQIKKKDSVLLLVGDGQLRRDIEIKIERLGIKDKVILTGVVPNVNDYMQAMDFFLFPSLWEGLPVTVIEAQASGLTCAISDRITQEVNITPFIQTISLDETAEVWADKIILSKEGHRFKANDIIIKSGFDVRNSMEELTAFYEDISGTEN